METNYSKGNTNLKILLGIIIMIFLLAWFRGCFNHSSPETIIVKHPAVVGSTKAVKPESTAVVIDEKGTAVLPKTIIKNLSAEQQKELQYKIDSLSNSIKNLQAKFEKAPPKIKDSLYAESNKLQSFSQSWDFPKLKATASGISRGTVESIKLDYEIKAYSDTIKVPKTKFRLLGGIETGATKDLSKMNFKANLMLQNAKGNILSAGYDSEQRIYIGYSVSIFSIKR